MRLARQEREFFLPEVDDLGVSHVLQELFAVIRLDEKSTQVDERPTSLTLKDGEDGVAEDRGHLVAPARRQPPEDRHEIRREERPLQLRVGREDVEADRIFGVRRVEKHHVFESLSWHAPKNLVNEIPMRIENGKPLALG